MLVKPNRLMTATAFVALIIVTVSWHVAAQVQIPKSTDAFADWKYEAVLVNYPTTGFGDMPFRSWTAKTSDPIQKVYAYYENKAVLGATQGHSSPWQDVTQHILVASQTRDGGYSVSSVVNRRSDPDNAILVIHQPSQTVVVTISRDADDKSLTDISVIADKRDNPPVQTHKGL